MNADLAVLRLFFKFHYRQNMSQTVVMGLHTEFQIRQMEVLEGG